ncbi:hypothetical protein [Brevibacterium oceani]|uniref:hypothetical protein n=1 Tax=Brevibacterium oceani TaxID=358099 RepID=UPI0015E7D45A|nr:hypothetical protein [Brevibacterium oceani]
MSDYTPTRWHIRELWINSRPEGITEKEAHNGFCTWLAEEMADGWDVGYATGIADCPGVFVAPVNPFRRTRE